jgi:hypothetical protein
MDFDLQTSVALLERTPRVLNALLGGLPSELTGASEGPGTWSPYDVLGHLIYGERTDWLPRIRVILEYGAGRPFEPFDREAMFKASAGKLCDQLLTEFSELRAANIDALRGLRLETQQLDLPGLHPALGPVSLRQLLAAWTAHDQGHLVQICRTLARQYRQAVGPWREYISVLH